MTDKEFHKLIKKTLNRKPEDDVEFYLQANEELENKTYDIKLWQKANVLTCSEDEKARNKYVELRVKQLRREAGQDEIIEDSKSIVSKKENNKIHEKDFDIISSEINQGFWSKLMNGDFGLAKTYWGYGWTRVIAIFFLIIVVPVLLHINIDTSHPFFLVPLILLFIAYETVVHIGVWRASKKYAGPQVLSYLAQTTVVGFGLFAFFILSRLTIKFLGIY